MPNTNSVGDFYASAIWFYLEEISHKEYPGSMGMVQDLNRDGQPDKIDLPSKKDFNGYSKEDIKRLTHLTPAEKVMAYQGFTEALGRTKGVIQSVKDWLNGHIPSFQRRGDLIFFEFSEAENENRTLECTVGEKKGIPFCKDIQIRHSILDPSAPHPERLQYRYCFNYGFTPQGVAGDVGVQSLFESINLLLQH